MDLTFKTNTGRFNFRVCGIILYDHKILAMHDETSPYYYLPGGRVHLHETCEDAIIREMKEELEIDMSIIRPLWLNQAFFCEDVSNEKFHEICIYYLMEVNHDLLSKGNRFVLSEGKHTHVFEWLEFEKLKNEYFYPIFLKKEIFNLPQNLQIITNYD